jgi:uncharacterized protein (TIGR00369 family)
MIQESPAIPRLRYNAQIVKNNVNQKSAKKRPEAARRKNFCFGCGKDNPDGMGLKFAIDGRGKQFVSRFRLSKRYTGPPGHCHGGIIATILDEAMSKLNRLYQTSAATSRMTVEYLRPVPLHTPLQVRSRNMSRRGRRFMHAAQILDEKGTVLARSHGVFVALDPEHVFRKK